MLGGNKLNFKNDADKNFSKAGISLVTLVITIIVIIILAAIAIFSSLTTVDNANYASFVSEYDEVNSGTQATLKNNILNGNSEEARNQGFTKVKIDNAPGSFISVSDGAIEGYLVDLDTIKVTGTKTGKGEVINETVTFGKDDVYVYDDDGKVYYAKGYSDGDGQVKYKLDETFDLTAKPTIENIDVILSPDKSFATIKVTANSGKGGELTVVGNGKHGTKAGDNVYEIIANSNGTVVVIVREAGGGSAMQEVEISGIVKPKNIITYDANGGSNAPASQEIEEGKSTVLSTSVPVRSGYTFLGWAEEASATTAKYKAGGTYSKSASITLYAVWKSRMLTSIPTVTMSDYVYGQTASMPQISANPGNGTVTYYYNTNNSNSGGTLWSNTANIDAGIYYMYAKITDMKDYDDATTGAAKFEVKKANGSISWQHSTITKAIGDGAFSNTLSKTGDGTVTFSSTNESVATVDSQGNVTVKGVGATEIKAKVADGKNYTYTNNIASYILTVNKGNITSATVTMGGYTYGQTPSDPSIKGNTSSGMVTYYYNSSNSNSGGTVWDGITSTSLNAGTYYIYAVIAETGSYNSFTTPATSFTIAKATTGSIKYTKSEITKTTNDEPFTNSINNIGDGKVSYTSSNTNVATVDSDGKVTIKDAGETTITATVANGTNYTYTSANSTASYTLKVEVPVYYLMKRRQNYYGLVGEGRVGCNSDYSSDTIRTITFQNKKKAPECYEISGESTWDVSLHNDGTVMAYLVKNIDSTESKTYYDLYIGADTGENGRIIAPEDFGYFFNGYSVCEKINNLSLIDTKDVTNMAGLFDNCELLTELDLSDFETDKVTDMSWMFTNCKALTSLDLSNFNTSNVTNMKSMFSISYGNLETLNLGNNFNTAKAEDMSRMFYWCRNLTDLDVSNFDTVNVTDMSEMFYLCEKLIDLDVSDFNTSKVTNMAGMFYECSALTNLDVSGFDTSKVTNMSRIFEGCSGLTSLDVSVFNTSKVTNMSRIFEGCSGLTSLDVSVFNTSKVTNMASMFYECSALTNLDVSGFDTSKVTNMSYMFARCSGLTSLDLSNFDTSKVTNMSSMFYFCKALTALNVSGFNTSKVTNMGYMFSVCVGVTRIDVTSFNTSLVTNMSYMFMHCESLNELNLKNFDTGKTMSMEYMFYNCKNLTNLDLSSFNTSRVQEINEMFYSCDNLELLKLGEKFNKINGYMMFYNCNSLTKLITVRTVPMTLNTYLNSNCILYVLNEDVEKAFESGENYLTVFGSASDVVRDDGSTDIYRIRPILELVGDSEVSFEIGGTYSELGVKVAGMNKNASGDYTPFGYTVSTSIKDKNNNVVNEIDTSRVGTYTVTYKLSDESGEVAGAEVSRTVKVTMVHSVANGPVLNTSEMKAVYWNESGDEFETNSFELAQTEEGTIYNTTLYNYNYSFDDDIYELGTDTYDVAWAKKPRWANAKTIDDGSYWVWIPRYAYKITYYTSDAKTTISNTKSQYGSIDVIFLKDKSNNEYIDKNGDTQTLPSDYTVHPAFQAMSQEEATAGNPLGKWSEELTGIWVAKYEASQEILTDSGWTTTASTNGGGNVLTVNSGDNQTRVVSKPSVISWRSIQASNMYTNCLNMNTVLATHQMKNSEWGAVAYLTYSVYGRNGNELAVNQCSSYYTGGGPGKGYSKIYNSTYAYDENTFSGEYAYNTTQGKLASTTGNIYGIYDMSGGAWEYTASYVNNGHDNLMTYGNDSENSGDNLVNDSEVTRTRKNMKTKQIYLSTTSSGEATQSADYNLCKDKNGNLLVYGDAVYETSTNSSGNNSWRNGYSYFPYSSVPFFTRGGYYNNASNAGAFYFDRYYGDDRGSGGFRPVVCVSSST